MKLLSFSLVPFLALFLTGCVELDQEITINRDGSGTHRFRGAIPLDAVAMIEAMKKQAAGREGMNTAGDLPVTEDDIRRKFAHGTDVKLTELKVEDRDGKRHVHFTLSAEYFLRLFEVDGMKSFTLSKESVGNWINAPANYALGMPFSAPENKPGIGQEKANQELMRAMMLQTLKGLRLSFTVNTPGEIIATSAHAKTARSATWIYDIDKNPAFLDKPPEISVKFKGAGLNLPGATGRIQVDRK